MCTLSYPLTCIQQIGIIVISPRDISCLFIQQVTILTHRFNLLWPILNKNTLQTTTHTLYIKSVYDVVGIFRYVQYHKIKLTKKEKYTTLSERIQNPVPKSQKEAKSHKYTTARFLDSPDIIIHPLNLKIFALFVQCFVEHCLSRCPFSIRHCIVCSSKTYGF